jgi:hypothetical protein
MLLLVVTRGTRPARIVLRTGAVHFVTHLLTCDLLDDLLLRLLANRQSPAGPDEIRL